MYRMTILGFVLGFGCGGDDTGEKNETGTEVTTEVWTAMSWQSEALPFLYYAESTTTLSAEAFTLRVNSDDTAELEVLVSHTFSSGSTESPHVYPITVYRPENRYRFMLSPEDGDWNSPLDDWLEKDLSGFDEVELLCDIGSQSTLICEDATSTFLKQ